MKKIIIFTMLLILSASTFSQRNKYYSNFSYQDYELKSKRQKTAAWILLGVGFGLSMTGGAIAISQSLDYLFEESQTGMSTGAVMVLAGNLAMLSSIPLFISAKQNKKRTMFSSAGFKMEKLALNKQKLFIQNSFPAFSVKISL